MIYAKQSLINSFNIFFICFFGKYQKNAGLSAFFLSVYLEDTINTLYL